MHRITTFKVIQNFGVNRQWGVLDRHRTRKEFHCLGLSQDLSLRKERYNRGRRKRLRRTSLGLLRRTGLSSRRKLRKIKKILFEDFRDEAISFSSTSGID